MLKKSQLSGQLQNRETLQQQHHHYHRTTQKIFVPDSTQNTNSSQNLKSSEQEYNFVFCFFLPTPPAWTVCTCFRHRRSPSCYGVQSLISRSKQGGRRLFGANSTATYATPKSSEKEEVFVSSFSAHQWENQPPKKTKTQKTKPANLWNFALQFNQKTIVSNFANYHI